MSVIIAEFTGHESDADCKRIAWEMFCDAHPIEAFDHDPEAFWQFFQKARPGVSREQMKAGIKAVKASENQNP